MSQPAGCLFSFPVSVLFAFSCSNLFFILYFLSSILSAVGPAKVEGPAEEDAFPLRLLPIAAERDQAALISLAMDAHPVVD